MKIFITTLLCFGGVQAFSQSQPVVQEAMVSNWVRVELPAAPVRRTTPRAAPAPARRPTQTAAKAAAPAAPAKPPSSFKKTNTKVGRFKKEQ